MSKATRHETRLTLPSGDAPCSAGPGPGSPWRSATAERAGRDCDSGDLLVDFPWAPRRADTPELRLLLAIIIDAWDRVASFRRAGRNPAHRRDLTREARDVFRWIEGLTESKPRLFSFQSVCDHLGWEMTTVRRAFYGDVRQIGLGQQGTRAKIRPRRRRRTSPRPVVGGTAEPRPQTADQDASTGGKAARSGSDRLTA